MHRPARSVIVSAIVLALPFAAGCSKDDGTAGAASTDSTTAAATPAAPTPPAELATANDAFKAAWNAEDDAAIAAMFTDSATVVEDTMHFAGRSQIQSKWVKPNLKDIQTFATSDETWAASGADFTSHDKYSLVITMNKKPMTATGVYDATWTKGADGAWHVSSMMIHSDPPPPPPAAPATTTGL